ncbi:MAG: hypothetical protein FWH38_04750 [Treponema sp.]|nr:hypothetical protein [Treponema sp.]
MIKTVLKFALAVFVYTVVFSAANALLPFSQGFKDLGAPSDPLGLVYVFINSAWVCFAAFYIIRHTHHHGRKLIAGLAGVLFFVQVFMMQIETMFFIGAFSGITVRDVVLIMAAGLLPLLAVVPLMAAFFQCRDKAVIEKPRLDLKKTAVRLALIGIIYVCIYMAFGYFVAWQEVELRVFYSGAADKLSFLGQLANNVRTNPLIYPFQFVRGMLFGLFIIPLTFMIKNRASFLASVCFVYLSTATVLLIPNVLFPDMVRFAHLREMASSMLLFALIAGRILRGKDSEAVGV